MLFEDFSIFEFYGAQNRGDNKEFWRAEITFNLHLEFFLSVFYQKSLFHFR